MWRKSIFYFVCLLALVHSLLLQTANVPPIVSCFPLLSFKSKARVKVEDTAVVFKCQHLCVFCVGGGCLKEEVLSGTEAFCRCCKEGGLNGNFCGYQLCRCTLSDLKRYVTCGPIPTLHCRFSFANNRNVCHWLVLKGKVSEGSKRDLEMEKKRRKTCLLVKVGVDVV